MPAPQPRPPLPLPVFVGPTPPAPRICSKGGCGQQAEVSGNFCVECRVREEAAWQARIDADADGHRSKRKRRN
jgi:hypothetical protein